MTNTRKLQLKKLFPVLFHEIIEKEITRPYATERSFQYFEQVEGQQHALLIRRTRSGTWVFDFDFYEDNKVIYSIRNEPFVAGTEIVIDVMCYAAGIVPEVGTKVRLLGSMTKFPEKDGQIVYTIKHITNQQQLFVIDGQQITLPIASWTDYNDQFGRDGGLCPRLQPFFNGMSPKRIYARVEPISGHEYQKHELGHNLETIKQMEPGQHNFCIDSNIYYDKALSREQIETIIVTITLDNSGNLTIDEINNIDSNLPDDSRIRLYNILTTYNFKMLHHLG